MATLVYSADIPQATIVGLTPATSYFLTKQGGLIAAGSVTNAGQVLNLDMSVYPMYKVLTFAGGAQTGTPAGVISVNEIIPDTAFTLPVITSDNSGNKTLSVSVTGQVFTIGIGGDVSKRFLVANIVISYSTVPTGGGGTSVRVYGMDVGPSIS